MKFKVIVPVTQDPVTTEKLEELKAALMDGNVENFTLEIDPNDHRILLLVVGDDARDGKIDGTDDEEDAVHILENDFGLNAQPDGDAPMF